MTVASGLYGLTLEKFFIDTVGDSLEAEDGLLGLVDDTHTPAFDTDDFAADIDNEASGGNYAREEVPGTEITLSGGVLTWDFSDVVFDNGGSDDVSITDAEAAFYIIATGNDATAPLVAMWDFGSAASSTNSTFTVQVDASGAVTLDYVP